MQTQPQYTNTSLAAPGRNNTVLLFGEVLADIFPDRVVLGGAPFNVARHLKAFGQNPLLISRLGDDALAETVLKVMAETGMETLGVQRCKKYPTGRVQVRIDKDGHSFDILPVQAYDFIHPAAVRMLTQAANPALVYFGTLAQRHPVSARALRRMLRNTAAKKFLDVNLRQPWYDKKTLQHSLQDADIVKLNDDELSVVAQTFGLTGQDAHSQAIALMELFRLEQIIVTCGGAGAWHLTRNGICEVGAKDAAAKLVDTVGAGDGFAAVCMLGSLQQWPIATTLVRANAFAAALCEIRGAIPEYADFYEPFMREWNGYESRAGK